MSRRGDRRRARRTSLVQAWLSALALLASIGCSDDGKSGRTDDKDTAGDLLDATATDINTTDADATESDSGDATCRYLSEAGRRPCPGAAGEVFETGLIGTIIRVDGPAKRITVRVGKDGPPHAELDVGRWQVGVVPSWDEKHNYDPSLLPEDGPTGLAWASVTKMTAVPPHEAGAGPGAGEPDGDNGNVTYAAWRLDTVFAADAGEKAGTPGPALYLITGTYDWGPLRLRPADHAAAKAWAADQPAPDGGGRIMYLRISAEAPQDEGYYGLGEFFDTPQHRGKRRTMQIAGNFNLDGSSNEAHVRVPMLVGTHGWGLLVDSLRPIDFDVAATDPKRTTVTIGWHEATLRLLAGYRPLDVVGSYWAAKGKPQMPAPWAVGGLIWRNENKDQAEVLDDLAQIRAHDLALSGYWIDRPYDVAVNDFGFDPARYPDPPAMLKALHDGGLRLGLWSTPYLDPGYSGKTEAKNHKEAKEKGYFVTGPGAGSKILKWGPPIDFTNKDADAFFRKLIGQYQALGIEGYKLDYGEDIVLGLLSARIPWFFHDGSDERTMHRGFQLGYHAAYASRLPAIGAEQPGMAGLQGGGFILARASALGDQVHTSMIWPGDLCASWHQHAECDPGGKCHAGGLPASVSAAISLPTAGLPLFGADTGGYRHGRAPKELFLRWLQHTALTGVLQIGGGTEHHPWLSEPVKNDAAPGSPFDAETLDVARMLIRLHARLFPLIWTDLMAIQTAYSGVGPVRPLGLMLPELAGSALLRAHEATEHFFGDHLLVAPVVTPGTERDVFFPPGRWVDYFDGTIHEAPATGKVETLKVPLTKLPLYVRAGAIVPLLRPTIDTIAPAKDPAVESFANNPGLLWARVDFGGQPARKADDPAGVTALWDGTSLRASDAGAGKTSLRATGGKVFTAGVVWRLRGLAVAPKSVDGAVEALDPAESVTATEAKVASCKDSCWAVAPGGDVFVRAAFADQELVVLP
ncbi:MAG: glycoside hydrolase family 31 protein [Deltaproteobacteria bacterium]|nr:glycoside hydrolase family 31 protein [Deltaproteobacteria bacterium]